MRWKGLGPAARAVLSAKVEGKFRVTGDGPGWQVAGKDKEAQLTRGSEAQNDAALVDELTG